MGHTKLVVYVALLACNVAPEMLRHMTLNLKTLTVPNKCETKNRPPTTNKFFKIYFSTK